MATHFLWDPVEDNVIAEIDDSGGLIASYATEPDLYGNVASQYRDGQTNYFYSDGLGSTTEVTNDANHVLATRAYNAFGETTESTGSLAFPFQYVGQKGYYSDGGIAGSYTRRRHYNPINGRWLSSDPVDSAQAMKSEVNLYRYVSNRPVLLIDPSGRDWFSQGVECMWRTWNQDACIDAAPGGDIADAAYAFSEEIAKKFLDKVLRECTKCLTKTEQDKLKNNVMNAVRHAYWQAQLVVAYGLGIATTIADIHDPAFQQDLDSRADRFNNGIGQAIGKECTPRPDSVYTSAWGSITTCMKDKIADRIGTGLSGISCDEMLLNNDFVINPKGDPRIAH